MIRRFQAFACLVVAGLAACSTPTAQDDADSVPLAVETATAEANAAAPACYAPDSAPDVYKTFPAVATSTECSPELLQGFFQACYTAEATKDTCESWYAADGATGCGACTKTFSAPRVDAAGTDTGLPVPNRNSCIGKQLGSCVDDVYKFSQCSVSVCSNCATPEESTACRASATAGACNALSGPSGACVTAHQADLGPCVAPNAAALAADPAAGSNYLIRFYVGACMDPTAWAPAPPAQPDPAVTQPTP